MRDKGIFCIYLLYPFRIYYDFLAWDADKYNGTL